MDRRNGLLSTRATVLGKAQVVVRAEVEVGVALAGVPMEEGVVRCLASK